MSLFILIPLLFVVFLMIAMIGRRRKLGERAGRNGFLRALLIWVAIVAVVAFLYFRR